MSNERMKLAVLEVKEPLSIGSRGAQKLSFKGKGPDGKELWYFTFKTTLFQHITQNADLDADVVIENREYQGETYIDRKVMELYVNGKPVSATGKGYGGRGNADAQIAAQVTSDLLVEKVISHDNPLAKALMAWLADKLKV